MTDRITEVEGHPVTMTEHIREVPLAEKQQATIERLEDRVESLKRALDNIEGELCYAREVLNRP